MVPRILLDTAPLPGGGELRLVRRGDEYSIMLGAEELMNSRRSGSEAALAALACDALGDRPGPRVLIGGLGLGFTLRAALERLPEDAEVAVAELVPAVVRWARGELAHLHGASLDDKRVRILEQDVAVAIADGPWDAILLDVDNGPDGLTLASNDRLYAAEGLAAARHALRPGGVLAVWSAGPDAAFTARLRRAGFRVEAHEARSGAGRGARHVVWIAARA
ncbi:MAG: spermidine synthase [Allosphingosinicella sp.]